MAKTRCAWAGDDPVYQKYHDLEWGVPLHSDKKLFEFLILEGMQAGLSWITILKKREAFREAFDSFDYNKVAGYSQAKIDELMQNPGIIRNKLKIHAAVTNARAFLQVRKEFGTFNKYIWGFVDNIPPAKCMAQYAGTARQYTTGRSHLKRPEKKRLQFCRADHSLLTYAGNGHGE